AHMETIHVLDSGGVTDWAATAFFGEYCTVPDISVTAEFHMTDQHRPVSEENSLTPLRQISPVRLDDGRHAGTLEHIPAIWKLTAKSSRAKAAKSRMLFARHGIRALSLLISSRP